MNKQPLRITERITRWVGSVPSLVFHTAFFIVCFAAVILGWLDLNTMLLVLTTVVSLEAIYLAIFIQMTVNENTVSLRGVEEDIDEIQEDVEEMQEDVEEMQEDVEEMSEDESDERTLEEIHAGLKKLMQDIERLQQKGS